MADCQVFLTTFHAMCTFHTRLKEFPFHDRAQSTSILNKKNIWTILFEFYYIYMLYMCVYISYYFCGNVYIFWIIYIYTLLHINIILIFARYLDIDIFRHNLIYITKRKENSHSTCTFAMQNLNCTHRGCHVNWHQRITSNEKIIQSHDGI